VREFAQTWLVKGRLPAAQPAPRIVVLFPGETSEQRRHDD
jgi:hypothetical protein